MSRTTKDRRDVKARRRGRKDPNFKQSFRAAKMKGFAEDGEYELCPDCGAHMDFERGFLTCGECHWGSYLLERQGTNQELDFSNVA